MQKSVGLLFVACAAVVALVERHGAGTVAIVAGVWVTVSIGSSLVIGDHLARRERSAPGEPVHRRELVTS